MFFRLARVRVAQISCGRLIARLLARSWRSSFPAPELSESQLARIAPLLLDSGGGALAWRRINQSELAHTTAGLELQQAFRQHLLLSGYFEMKTEEVIRAFRGASLEPNLIKGWSIARAYPLTGLRPYGDIDLCVRPNDYERAIRLIKSLTDTPLGIDLHCGFGMLLDRDTDRIFERSPTVKLGKTSIRVLSEEDQLHLLCVHLLRHGAARPLWLCDVAVAMETRSDYFDWDWCLGTKRYRTNWIACVIKLVNEILGADDKNLPESVANTKLPGWFIPTVLRQWGIPFANHPSRQPALRTYLNRPLWWWKALKDRWPNPIQGVVSHDAPFSNPLPLPYQVRSYVRRAARYSASLLHSSLPSDLPAYTCLEGKDSGSTNQEHRAGNQK